MVGDLLAGLVLKVEQKQSQSGACYLLPGVIGCDEVTWLGEEHVQGVFCLVLCSRVFKDHFPLRRVSLR